MTKELSKQICEICGIKDNVDFGEAEKKMIVSIVILEKMDYV